MISFLERKAKDPKIKGNETVKLCKVAANIALDVLKLEGKYIKAVKQRFSINGRSKDKYS